MVFAPSMFALWMWPTALVAAVLFVVSALMIIQARAYYRPPRRCWPGYPFLMLTFVGRIQTLVFRRA